MSHLPSIHLLQFVPESLPTFRSDVAVLFGKYLPCDGIQCHIIGMPGKGESTNQGFASVQRANGIGGRWRQEFSYLILCLRTLLGVRKQPYDIIQVRDMVSIGLLAMLVARMKGIPFVYWISYLLTEDRIERGRTAIKLGAGFRYRLVLLKGLIERAILYGIVLPGARHIFVQSEAMKKLMVLRGIQLDKLTAVPMGVDTEILFPGSVVRRRLPGWKGIPLIAYLGTLDTSRRLHELVDVLSTLRVRYPQARLLFIGGTPSRSDTDELLAYVNRLGLNDAVHVTGWLPAREAWSLLAGADAAISYIPRSEILDVSSPTKLLEYLALGIPCVGNDNPAQVEVLLASGAGWLSKSSVEDMSQAISEILLDPESAHKRAAAGPAYIDKIHSYYVLATMVAKQYRLITTHSHLCKR